MITKINDNIADYQKLFKEAADVLTGFKSIRTYDNTNDDGYYYKNDAATSADDLFIQDDSIINLFTFAKALEEHIKLYVRIKDAEGNYIGIQDGFEPMNGITSLEEYFSWLKTLGNIQAFEDRDFGKKYTILPLDEPHFEINANTRAIQIPNEFKKNGIAVQTDDLAEIVYFEVDRYFDYMDLNNCDIYIQWEIPKSGEKNVSVPYVRDIESKPGKLIFGWAISDALTGTAGTLKFSVRFFQWKDDE